MHTHNYIIIPTTLLLGWELSITVMLNLWRVRPPLQTPWVCADRGPNRISTHFQTQSRCLIHDTRLFARPAFVRNNTSSADTTTQCFLSPNRPVSFRCCFTSTETIRLIRDGEPRTPTSTFTQLRKSVEL